MKEIDITFKTMFSELEQRSLDASFATEFSTDGNFVRQTSKDKEFWYFQIRTDGVAHRKYVGPISDEEITKRVRAFNEIKNDLKSRRQLVSTLTRNAGLPKPENFTGDVVEAPRQRGLLPAARRLGRDGRISMLFRSSGDQAADQCYADRRY